MEELNEDVINIEEFKRYIEELKLYEDERLDIIIKICIESLWFMSDQGYDMPKKALIEIKKHL